MVLWALFGWSDFWYGMLLLVATGCCAWEWSTLGNLADQSSRVVFSVMVTLAAALAMWFSGAELLKLPVLIAVLSWIAIVLDLYVRPTVAKSVGVRWPLLLLAAFILIVSVTSLFWLRKELSATFIVFVVALVAAADIGAYFSGRKFGKNKLAVDISSGKTIEGAVGGMLAAIALTVVFVAFFSIDQPSVFALIVFSLIAAVFSIAGDLFISRAKRTSGVKDSGNLLPGHGGVLDRFDGLLAAIPWMVFAILWT